MIGIIGGSGFYNFLENPDTRHISTYYGDLQVDVGALDGIEVCFIPRHGRDHSTAPGDINYQRNIMAAYQLGVSKIIVTNAVGALTKEYTLGDFVLPDQVLDTTHSRESTFVDDLPSLPVGDDVDMHTDVSYPFDNNLRDVILSVATSKGLTVKDGATLVVTNGPRFETPAEIDMYRKMGADIVGMTTAPEVFLANEVGIPYASIALVTNYAAGMQKEVTEEEVFEIFKRNIKNIKKLVMYIIQELG